MARTAHHCAMKTIKLSAALALALTAALLAADASSASSIVFTKGGNVWRSSPDGRHQARLTRDGGYSSPHRTIAAASTPSSAAASSAFPGPAAA
jgi:hypothetical protein